MRVQKSLDDFSELIPGIYQSAHTVFVIQVLLSCSYKFGD